MNPNSKPVHRCAIYTRKSSEEGLEQSFNSLHAQREACMSYIKSQQHEGWMALSTAYDDGGFSGGNTDRPALQQLLDDIRAGRINIVVVYKVDRLSRSLADFVRLIEFFDEQEVSFVSVTQQFNTSSSMGRLTLNVLLSFAQFEREVTSERIRDKIAASKRKGMWMGGAVPLGYDVIDKALVVNESEAPVVRHIYQRYADLKCVRQLKAELDAEGYLSKVRNNGQCHGGGKPFSRGALYSLLKSALYIGKVVHQGRLYEGRHAAIVDETLWQRVQAILKDNHHQNRLRTQAKNPSLLAGRVFDDNGNHMSPTHTHKYNRRYRYYVSQAILQYREADVGSITRISAKTLENLVLGELQKLWVSPRRLLDILDDYQLTARQHTCIQQRVETLAKTWTTMAPHQALPALQAIVRKITVARDGVEMVVSRGALLKYLLGKQIDSDLGSDPYPIHIPAQLKRCGIETKLILNNESVETPHYRTVNAIQEALRRALQWHDDLMSGRVATMAAIARQEGCTQRHIAHLIYLAFLAPDIIEAIFKGQIPASISLHRLRQGFPLDWAAQRLLLNFPASPTKSEPRLSGKEKNPRSGPSSTEGVRKLGAFQGTR